MQPAVSILIATQGRAPQLQRLLDSLVRLENHQKIPHEILVGNNAQGQASATVEALLQPIEPVSQSASFMCANRSRENHALSIGWYRSPKPTFRLSRRRRGSRAGMVADHLAILPRLFLRCHAGLDSHTGRRCKTTKSFFGCSIAIGRSAITANPELKSDRSSV